MVEKKKYDLTPTFTEILIDYGLSPIEAERTWENAKNFRMAITDIIIKAKADEREKWQKERKDLYDSLRECEGEIKRQVEKNREILKDVQDWKKQGYSQAVRDVFAAIEPDLRGWDNDDCALTIGDMKKLKQKFKVK